MALVGEGFGAGGDVGPALLLDGYDRQEGIGNGGMAGAALDDVEHGADGHADTFGG